MKKFLSIFALVLCAISLPTAFVGCKKVKKQNGPDYIVGKTYKYVGYECVGVDKNDKEKIDEDLIDFIGSSFVFDEKTGTLTLTGEQNKVFYKVDDDKTIHFYQDEEMTKEFTFETGGIFLFSKDYKKFYCRMYIDENNPNIYVDAIYSC